MPVTIRGDGYSYDGDFYWDYWDFSGGIDGTLEVRYGTEEEDDYSAQGYIGTPRYALDYPPRESIPQSNSNTEKKTDGEKKLQEDHEHKAAGNSDLKTASGAETTRPVVRHSHQPATGNATHRRVIVIVSRWPDGTMAFKFCDALQNALGVTRDSMHLVQLEPERIFAVLTKVTEKGFRKNLKSKDVSTAGKIHFIEV